MNDDKASKNAMAGGFFIAAGILLGLVAGIATNEISIGMFGGFVAGTAVAIIVWLIDSRKK